MTDLMKLGPWIRRFLLEHLINERNLSRGTQRSYRDTLTLLIPFVARKTHRRIDQLDVLHVSSDLVRMFLLDLEKSRGSAISTRNNTQPALGSHPLPGPVRSPLQPGTHRLVRTNLRYTFQEMHADARRVSGES